MLTIWQTSLRRRFSSLYIGILAATSAGSYLLRDIPGFSSLYIGILAATGGAVSYTHLYLKFQFPLHRDPRCNLDIQTFRPDSISFSSLYIGILAATSGPNTLINMPFCFSSLYIGILAATGSESVSYTHLDVYKRQATAECLVKRIKYICFSSLYIGILAATTYSR